MKRRIALILPVLILLLGLGITLRAVFSFNANVYIENVSKKVSDARSVSVSLEAKLTGGKAKMVNHSASGLVVFPGNHRVEGKIETPTGSEDIAEIATGDFIYRKTQATEGKWVTLERTDREGIAKDRRDIRYARLLKDLIGSVAKIDGAELENRTRTIRATLDWTKYLASTKTAGVSDWFAEELQKVDTAKLTLQVDEPSGYVTRSELNVTGGGKILELDADYSGWNEKVGISAPPLSETLSKEAAERIFTAKKHFEAGLVAYKANDTNGAVDEFDQAVKYQPKNYTYNVWLAKAQLRKRNYSEAEFYAQKAMGLDQSKADAYVVASQVMALDDQWKPQRRTQAISYAQQAVKLNSNSPEAYTALGLAYWLKAMPSLEDSATMPVEYPTWVREETPSVPSGFYKNRAVVALDKAIELDPNAAEPLFIKGFMLITDVDMVKDLKKFGFTLQNVSKAQDNFDRASEIFTKVATINPNFVEDKLAFSAKGFADLSKDNELMRKYGKLRDLSETLMSQGTRWKELKGVNARRVMDDWEASLKDYVDFLFKMAESPQPQYLVDAFKTADDILKIMYITI
ncbi:MAG: tetratricopeptide repeat protein [Actinobacteria bacterium]|nr:tetratricopeptide repeat protein [Actinomycetota bacterium]